MTAGRLAPSGPAVTPLRVGVLVDLVLTEDAGGHVKCWQRIAEAATAFPDRLDLTVHFNGPQSRVIALSPTVRYRLLPPVFSTAWLIRELPDHTDLSPWHPQLARDLGGYDVIHTTDGYFCYARTAARFARRRGVPVVSSIHTNVPEYARVTTSKLLERSLGGGRAYAAANDVLGVPRLVGAILERRLARHLGQVTAAMTGPGEQNCRQGRAVLRRGLDHALFTPARRDRAGLAERFGLPAGQLIAIYAGKLNAGKNVPLLAPIIAQARQRGAPVHLLCAGSGSEHGALEAALGGAITCAGTLGQDELARAYASADLFLFPSTIDEWGNVAAEALACGLPALLAAGSGIALRMANCAGVMVLPGGDPAPWAKAIADLAAAPERRAAMGQAARAYVETRVPSWAEVLCEDLLPVWRAAAAR